MNLILQEVEEDYTVRIKVQRTKLVHSTRVVQPDALPGAAQGESLCRENLGHWECMLLHERNPASIV